MSMIVSGNTVNGVNPKEDKQYEKVLERVKKSFTDALNDHPVFLTDATDLFDVYLENLPVQSEEERQACRCNACKSFFKKYGGLVTVTQDGDLIPVMWQVTGGGFYQPAIDAVNAKVSKANIVSVYYTDEKTWGIPESDGFIHFSVTPPAFVFGARQYTTVDRMMSENRKRFNTVMQVVKDTKLTVIDEMLRVLNADAVNRSARFLAPVQFLRDLHSVPKGKRGINLSWKGITLAPEGYCHPRAAVTWTLYEDIEAGVPFDVIRRKFNIKVNGTNFQRAQTPPAAGTILQAEKLVQELGIALSFERRYARLDEVKKVWEPTPDPVDEKKPGLFAHLKPKKSEPEVQAMQLPKTTMTWEKFTQKVLPGAHKIQVQVPVRASFVGTTTAEHADAPPILKWDTPESRYPISVYMYHEGSSCLQWGLEPMGWVETSGLMPIPVDNAAEVGGLVMILPGAMDSRADMGNGLFAETIRSDLHGIRSVIEAYSKGAVLGGRENASANGLQIGKGNLHLNLRVFDGTHWNEYYIDRFE